MKTLIIAEIGINHGGSVEEAKRLIKAAQESGADIAKIQTYTTEKRVTRDNPAFDILKGCELTYDQQRELKKYADEIGIEFLSTAFDVEALKFLVEDLGLRRVKIASFDTTNLAFLCEVNEMAQKYPELNVILSTGMTDYIELDEAVGMLPDTHLTLLWCKSAYPPKEEQLNFRAIKSIKAGWNCCGEISGYSNHVKDPLVPALSVLVGAEVIEAHFMVGSNDACCDALVSLDAAMFKEMVSNVRRFERIMGDGVLRVEECEKGTMIFKRYSK